MRECALCVCRAARAVESGLRLRRQPAGAAHTLYFRRSACRRRFGVKMANLAQLTGVHRNTLRNPASEYQQGRMREMVKLISAATELTGDVTRRSTGIAMTRSPTMANARRPSSSHRARPRRFWLSSGILRTARAGEDHPHRSGRDLPFCLTPKCAFLPRWCGSSHRRWALQSARRRRASMQNLAHSTSFDSGGMHHQSLGSNTWSSTTWSSPFANPAGIPPANSFSFYSSPASSSASKSGSWRSVSSPNCDRKFLVVT